MSSYYKWLQVYLGDDDNIWALNQVDGRRVQLSVTGPAPSYSNPTTQFQGSDGSSLEVSISDVGGDLVIKALSGPNAGKSVNLTYGRWV